MIVEEIRKCSKEGNWYILPNGNHVILGEGVILGDWVTLGNWVILGDGVTLGNCVILGEGVILGDGVRLGNCVILGNGVTLGDWVILGDGVTLEDDVTSEQLNKDMIKLYKKQFGKSFLATKWVTQNRISPNFDGGTKIKYKKGSIVEAPNAVVSDRQCAAGLHVLRYGYRPEWMGLCEADHNYIPLTVEIQTKDICFAGIPTMENKLRVKKLKVID